METQETIGLFYDEERNLLVDEDGFEVSNIFEVITPNDLYMFKQDKEYMLTTHVGFPEVLVELYYPEADY